MPPTPDHLAHLDADAAAVAALTRTADPGAPVEGCPGWALRDLVLHLGQIHRWATEVVRTGDKQLPAEVAVADAALADWLAEGAAALSRALRAADPDRPCWGFGGPGGTVAFWRRRQAVETALHRVDVERAVGATHALDEGLAEDGLDELVDVLQPRQVRLGRSPEPTTGAVLRAPSGRSWLLGAEPPCVTVEARAGDLLLLLWRRVPPASPALTVTGDPAALDALLATGLTP